MITLNLDGVESVMREEAAKLLLRAAVILQAEHKRDLSRKTNPPPHTTPSRPGEFPAIRTGNLRDSPAFEPTDLAEVRQTLTVRVGIRKNAEYGWWLYRKGWLGLPDTLARVRDRLMPPA